MLSAEGISYRIGGKELLQPTDLAFAENRFHVIMGSNGAGKSTLLKVLAGDQKPSSGTIRLQQQDLFSYSKKELAERRAVLSQHYTITFPISVNEIVLMGRYPWFTSHPAPRDRAICREALAAMHMEEFSGRDYNTLSGGEAQKVQMSRVLAQIWESEAVSPKLLFLDEPVSHLDVKYQHQLLRAARALCARHTTVIAILHDINLALAYADRLLFMKGGKVVYDLPDPKAVSADIIREVFDVSASILHPEGHPPVIIF